MEAIARVSAKADPTVRHVLEAIHGSLKKAEAQSLAAYRSASKERHRLLSRMRPAWQTIQTTLKQTDKGREFHPGTVAQHRSAYGRVRGNRARQ